MQIQRIWGYCQRYGFRATAKRVFLSLKRALRGNRMVLFYCDLACCGIVTVGETEQAKVERKYSDLDLDPCDMQQIIELWNSKLMKQQIAGRFSQGATLWLFKLHGKLAAYGWTIVGHPIQPHFLPFASGDVHLFDFFVFPEYRGRGINVSLVIYILRELALEKRNRAFIESAEWNRAQLASLRKTPFIYFGCAQKLVIFGKTIVVWSGKKPPGVIS